MSEVRKNYIRDPNLGPVKLARVERWNGGALAGVDGFEVAFEESSPDARESRFVYILKCLAIFPCVVCFVLLLSVGPFWVVHYLGSGYFSPDQWMIAGIVIAGTIAFAVLCIWMLPPHRAAVSVFMAPGTDRLSIYRRGRLAETAQLSHVRGVSIEPHPKLADALSELEMKQDWGNRRQVNIYRQAETIYLMIGAGVTVSKIEAASFMGKKEARERLAMAARAALEVAWQGAMALKEEKAQAHEGAPETNQTSGKRRRRGRLD